MLYVLFILYVSLQIMPAVLSALSRSRGMLSNERFLSKAPEAKIAEEKEKLAKYEQMMEQVTKRLEQLA